MTIMSGKPKPLVSTFGRICSDIKLNPSGLNRFGWEVSRHFYSCNARRGATYEGVRADVGDNKRRAARRFRVVPFSCDRSMPVTEHFGLVLNDQRKCGPNPR